MSVPRPVFPLNDEVMLASTTLPGSALDCSFITAF